MATRKVAVIAPEEGLTPLSLVASDANKKLESVVLGTGLSLDSGSNLSLIPSEIDHDSLLNVHQDVNTDASPVFAGATIGSVAIPGMFTAMTEPTGFVDRVATISWNDATYTLTITGNHDIYINGVKTTKTTASIQITDATGLYYIYYNAAGTLTSSTVHPGFALPLMATVYWNTTTDKGLVGEERHGIKMDTDTHTLLHYTVGARYESGLAGTFADTTFSIAAGVIDDEDIVHSITPAKTTCNVLYKDGAAEFKWLAGQTKYYYEDGGSDLNYNNGNTLTPLAANKYMAVWIFATNDTTTPIVSLIGQRTDTTITDARNNNKYESLTLGTLPFQEMKLLYRVILQNTATPYVETQDLRNISNLPAGTYVATAHNVLTGLDYDSAGHTGFEPTVTKGNLTAGSTKITIGGTGTGALIGAGATVDVSEANVVHDNLSGFVANEHIDHTTVSISAGTGMSGGGTIAADRTLNCTITQYTDALARTACIAASISDGDTTHSPDGNSVFDALALKAPLISPSFTTPTLGAALATSISIDGHILNSTEFHYLDGQDQSVVTTAQPTFAGVVVTQVTSLPSPVVQNKLILLNNATKTALYFGKWSTTSTASDVVAHYKMNDNAADKVIADSSGNALNGVSIANTDTMTVAGVINTALEFDGSVDYGRITDNDLLDFGTGDFAAVFWMKTTTAGTMRLLNKRTDSQGWEICINTGQNYPSCLVGDAGGYSYGSFTSYTGNLRDGSWHHIVLNFDRDGNVTPYIDNVAYTGFSISLRTGTVSNLQDLAIGIYNDWASSKYTGYLDDIRLYNRLLTVQEIANLDNQGSGTEGGEQPYWAELTAAS